MTNPESIPNTNQHELERKEESDPKLGMEGSNDIQLDETVMSGQVDEELSQLRSELATVDEEQINELRERIAALKNWLVERKEKNLMLLEISTRSGVNGAVASQFVKKVS